MSHPFGDLVWHHLVRKRGLSQNKLAMGINQDPAVIARMCYGKSLTGPQSRDRVLQIIDWLHQQGVLSYVDEANALLVAADKPPLSSATTSTTSTNLREAALLGSLRGVEHDSTASAVSQAQPESASAHKDTIRSQQKVIPLCPYRGLFPFREEDASYFYGLETFTSKLSDAVQARHQPLTAVLGPSGSGKSSVVFAGLVPLLREAGDWLITSCRPGEHPLRALAAALIALLESNLSETDRLVEVSKLASRLQDGNLSVEDVVRRIIEKHPGSKYLLLVIDQFEELYTLCRDADECKRFLDVMLTSLPSIPAETPSGKPQLSLVVTLRADFLGQALSYRSMVEALQGADLKIGPMNAIELRTAIEKPAQLIDVQLEDGLTERILAGVKRAPGNLPLLEFALTLLWARQHNGRLTHAAYDEMGGVEKALAGYAEEVYTDLSADDQRRAERALIQLVQPGERTEDTRRLATRAEVGASNWDLVTRLANARLVVTGREEAIGDEATDDDTVELVHEALITGWDRLRQWVDTDREFRTWQERLRSVVRQWQANGRDNDLLLRGAPLIEAERWLQERRDDLSALEVNVIQASADLRERERIARDRLRRRITAGLAIGLLLALVLAFFAVISYLEAQNQQKIARSRELAVKADKQLTIDPDLSLLLAIEAAKIAHTSEAEAVLRAAIIEPQARLTLHGHTSKVNCMTFSPDGLLLLTGSEDGTVKLWDTATGHAVRTLTMPTRLQTVSPSVWVNTENNTVVTETARTTQDIVNSAAFNPDGGSFVTAGSWGTVRAWSVATGQQQPVVAHADKVNTVMYSPDGSSILTASRDGTVKVRDVKTGKETSWNDASADTGEGLDAVAYSPDGNKVVGIFEIPGVSSGRGDLIVWDAHTGDEILTQSGAPYAEAYHQVAFSPDGSRILVVSYSAVTELDSSTLQVLTTISDNVVAAVYSPNGPFIATANTAGTIKIWDPIEGTALLTLVRPAKPSDRSQVSPLLAYSPDGRSIATAGYDDQEIEIWDLGIPDERGSRLAYADHIGLTGAGETQGRTYSPDGRFIMGNVFEAGGDVIVVKGGMIWDAVTGEEQPTSDQFRKEADSAVLSPDGTAILHYAADSSVAEVWDVKTQKEQLSLKGHTKGITYAVFSPDGHSILTASYDGTARVWNSSTGDNCQILDLPRDHLLSAIYSPHGRFIATIGEQDVKIWDAATGKSLRTLTGGSHTAAYSPDERFIITGSQEDESNNANVWDAMTGKKLLTLKGHSNSIIKVEYSPRDGRSILTASSDNTTKVWDAATGELRFTLSNPPRSDLESATFSPDGRFILTCCPTQQYFASFEELLKAASGRVARAFTVEERTNLLNEPLPVAKATAEATSTPSNIKR